MNNKIKTIAFLFLGINVAFISCNNQENSTNQEQEVNQTAVAKSITEKISQWKEIELKSDLTQLSDNEKEMIRLFLQASEIVDNIFWKQTYYGNKDEFLAKFKNADSLQYAKMNYGPWDRLLGRESFIKGFEQKALGANFYPQDIKYLPFISYQAEGKLSAYTQIKRDENGDLFVEPYNKAYSEEINKIAELLTKAATLSDNKSFAEYLLAKIEALKTNTYYNSEVAWMKVKGNKIDFLIGPVETYEDNFLQIKAAFESNILVKNEELSNKIQYYADLVDEFQQSIPCDPSYKKEQKAINADFGVYDIISYSGYSNAGAKTISINRPYDLQVLKEHGSKKLQFKNVTEAKFTNILLPIAQKMIDPTQTKLINANIFFESNILYEIAEQLGYHKTLKGTNIKDELKDFATIIDKTRSDIVRLFLVSQLKNLNKITQEDIEKHYITYVSNLFRIVRLGDGEAQAKADMIIFNFLQEKGAITLNASMYTVNVATMEKNVVELTALIHKIQETGDYAKAKDLVTTKGFIKDELKEELKKIKNIPIDLTFKQGKDILGL